MLNNVFVKNIYSLFVHNYDLDGFLNLKLVNKKFYKVLNEEKIYKEIFNIKKYIFFVDTFEEYKRPTIKNKSKIDYKLRVLKSKS